MNIKKVEHIAINTKSFEESLKFYRDILGFEQVETVDLEEFSITYLKLPGGSRLELFDYKGSNRNVKREESDVGLRHIAFEIDNIAKHEKRLRQMGVNITLPTTELPELGVRVLLFLDPNGVTLEFCEKL